MKYYQIQYNNNDFFAQMQRMRDDAQKLWDQMDHDVTKLSPELQQELAHLRQLILEMKPSMDEEEACMNRCMLIGR